MSIVRGQISTFSQINSTSLAVSWTTNPRRGSTILLFVQDSTAANPPTSVQDNGTTITTFTKDVGSDAQAGAYVYRGQGIYLPASGAYTVTVNESPANVLQAQGIEYFGVQLGPPTVTNVGTAASTACSSGSVTGKVGALYFGGFADNSGLNPATATFNSSPPFTEEARNMNGVGFWVMACGDAIIPAGGAQSLSWTLGVSAGWDAVIACYAASLDTDSRVLAGTY